MKFVDTLPGTTIGRQKFDYTKYVEELKVNPGRWGLITEKKTTSSAAQLVQAIKKGEAMGFDVTSGGYFEAASRKTSVYARWMPGKRASITRKVRSTK